MVQAVLTYLLVAVAAAWVVWSTLLPKPVKQALRIRLSLRKTAPAAKAGCDCGKDGGCH
jgi:hypothetical protein